MTRRLAALVVALIAVFAACGTDTTTTERSEAQTTQANDGASAAPTESDGEDTGTDDAPSESIPEGDDRSVERVVDGDTIVVDGGERVRLIGIDTPESVDPRRPVQCFGRESSAFMESLLPDGTPVRLVFDVEREDRYGRTLAYVYRLSDGLFVNLELAERGYAQVATYPPNIAHVDDFVEATSEAREAGRGLWRSC